MTFEPRDVAVDGGNLRVGVSGSGDDVVLALHGITGNHVQMATLAAALGDRKVIAPDLRGRGASADLGGPYSMRRHADDLAAALRELAPGGSAVVIGHSMGGFVALTLAAAYPDLVRSVVLVDGGPALPLPEGLTIDQILQAVIGPAMERLSMRFESRDAYLDWWRPHPALADPEVWKALEPSIVYDAVEDDDGWRSSVSLDAVRGDATSQLSEDPPSLVVPCPVKFLRAERGMFDQEGGLYIEELIAPVVAEAGVPMQTVPDCNHYSIAVRPHAVAAICAAVDTLSG